MSPGHESGECRREENLCSATLFPRRKVEGQVRGVVLHEKVKQWSLSFEIKRMGREWRGD